MEVIKISPRGFCFGVISALKITLETIKDQSVPRPIHLLGMIVHNKHITDALTEQGLITIDDKSKSRLELLDKIDRGTVIFTAHGVSPSVYEKAKNKGLHIIDASCNDVTKTHDYILDKIKNGYQVIYIGKKNHPEPEGAIGIAPLKIHLVETMDDVDNLNLTTNKIAITNQTTMSLWDVYNISEAITNKYPNAEFMKEICDATQVRQEAVATQAQLTDLVFVVGDPNSNNSRKLVEIAKSKVGIPAFLINNIEDINPEWLKNVQKVGVTSGASTPTVLTNEVIKYLLAFNYEDKSTWNNQSKLELKDILPKLVK